jgi:hypothetical protein
MKYLGKLTTQLDARELQGISDLFAAVFNKPVGVEQLLAKYRSPSRNSSYHGLMQNDDGRIAGALTVIPFDYSCFGKKAVFGCAVDLMIDKNNRNDLAAMKNMYNAVTGIIGETVDFLYAVPNRNSYLYFLKILGWKEIGKLDYYALPLRVSRLSPRLKGLDFLSQSLAAIINTVKWPAPQGAIEKPISKNRTQNFINYRCPPGRYQEIEKSGKRAWYAIVDEASTITVYIIDAWPLTAAWLSEVTNTVWRNEKKKIDLILYVGTGIPKVHNLFRVPLRFEPRSLHLIGQTLRHDNIDKRINKIENWQFNLSDLDVR